MFKKSLGTVNVHDMDFNVYDYKKITKYLTKSNLFRITELKVFLYKSGMKPVKFSTTYIENIFLNSKFLKKYLKRT